MQIFGFPSFVIHDFSPLPRPAFFLKVPCRFLISARRLALCADPRLLLCRDQLCSRPRGRDFDHCVGPPRPRPQDAHQPGRQDKLSPHRRAPGCRSHSASIGKETDGDAGGRLHREPAGERPGDRLQEPEDLRDRRGQFPGGVSAHEEEPCSWRPWPWRAG